MASRIEVLTRRLRELAVQIELLPSEDRVPSAAEQIIENLARAVGWEPPPLSIEIVAQHVCNRMNVTLREMKSPSRRTHLAFARQFAMFLAHEVTGLSYPRIGDFFHRDHSTVIHACKLMASRAAASEPFAAQVAALKIAVQPKRPDFLKEIAA
jgi:chromosomal replication initiator protein